MRIQRFNQQSYLGAGESNCENYFELHPVPEMLGSLSTMVFGTSNQERVRTCLASLQDYRNLQGSRAQGWLPVVWVETGGRWEGGARAFLPLAFLGNVQDVLTLHHFRKLKNVYIASLPSL